MHEARKCWDRGRLVRIRLNAHYSHRADKQRLFALRAQCGRDWSALPAINRPTLGQSRVELRISHDGLTILSGETTAG